MFLIGQWWAGVLPEVTIYVSHSDQVSETWLISAKIFSIIVENFLQWFGYNPTVFSEGCSGVK